MGDDSNIDLAKLAEQTERYDDMAKFMKEYTAKKGVLTSEERNLLSVAYKNVVGAKRSACRILSNMESKEKAAKDYRTLVRKELQDTCNEVLVSVSFSSVLCVFLPDYLCFEMEQSYLLSN